MIEKMTPTQEAVYTKVTKESFKQLHSSQAMLELSRDAYDNFSAMRAGINLETGADDEPMYEEEAFHFVLMSVLASTAGFASAKQVE